MLILLPQWTGLDRHRPRRMREHKMTLKLIPTKEATGSLKESKAGLQNETNIMLNSNHDCTGAHVGYGNKN